MISFSNKESPTIKVDKKKRELEYTVNVNSDTYNAGKSLLLSYQIFSQLEATFNQIYKDAYPKGEGEILIEGMYNEFVITFIFRYRHR